MECVHVTSAQLKTNEALARSAHVSLRHSNGRGGAEELSYSREREPCRSVIYSCYAPLSYSKQTSPASVQRLKYVRCCRHV